MEPINDIRPKLSQINSKFMSRLRAFIRIKNLAYRTEQTYCFWIKRYIKFHNMQQPQNMGS